jgi:hypothetical protein
LLVVYLSRACRAQTLDARQLLLSAFVASAVPLNIIAVLIMGNFFSSADARYALSFMFYPLFSAPVLLAGIQIPSAASRRLAPCAALLLAACAALDAAALTQLGGLKRYAEHYPEWVEWADTEMTARGLTEGAANYWDTKEMILLSRSNLRLVQSTEYLVPYNWISNTRWYDRFTPRFFLCSTNPKRTDRVQESSVTAKFGEPMERLVHGERSILIYPEESGLTHWYRDHPMRQEFLGVGDAAVFAAAELPGDIGEDGASSRIAEPPARPGSVTLGPYILMPKGSYRAVIRYSATPGPDYLTSGYWQLREVIRTEPRLIREAPLDPAKNEAVIEFDLAKRSSVELLTSYTGSGILEVISISFERTR